jgi:hypothetical protein
LSVLGLVVVLTLRGAFVPEHRLGEGLELRVAAWTGVLQLAEVPPNSPRVDLGKVEMCLLVLKTDTTG